VGELLRAIVEDVPSAPSPVRQEFTP
jgi:hypothetical protein